MASCAAAAHADCPDGYVVHTGKDTRPRGGPAHPNNRGKSRVGPATHESPPPTSGSGRGKGKGKGRQPPTGSSEPAGPLSKRELEALFHRFMTYHPPEGPGKGRNKGRGPASRPPHKAGNGQGTPAPPTQAAPASSPPGGAGTAPPRAPAGTPPTESSATRPTPATGAPAASANAESSTAATEPRVHPFSPAEEGDSPASAPATGSPNRYHDRKAEWVCLCGATNIIESPSGDSAHAAPPCRGCGQARTPECRVRAAGLPPLSREPPAPKPDPQADVTTKTLQAAITAAAATGVQAAVDLLQAQLDVHLRNFEASQPVEHRLSKARARALRLHKRHADLSRDVGDLESELDHLRSQLTTAERELREAQAVVADLAKQQPAPAPAPPSPFGPAVPDPSAEPAGFSALVAALRAHSADLPPAVKDAVAKVPAITKPVPKAQSPSTASASRPATHVEGTPAPSAGAPPPSGASRPATHDSEDSVSPMDTEEPPATQPGTQDPTKRDLARLVDAEGLSQPGKARRLHSPEPAK